MKRGQVSTGLVILGVVAIIAVIGLVLLFTRASADAAAIGDVYDSGAYAKGAREYVPERSGIAVTYPVNADPYGPSVEYPAPAGAPLQQVHETVGLRTPAYVVKSGYASLEDVNACEKDLWLGAKIPNPEEQFNCYAVPVKGASEGGLGYYPRASAAKSRPPEKYTGKTGGDFYCYANSVGAEQDKPASEQMIRENILEGLVKNKNGEHQWTSVVLNGVEVPVCWVSQEEFPFPQ